MRSQLVWIFSPRSPLHSRSRRGTRRSRRKRLGLCERYRRDITRARDRLGIIPRNRRLQQRLHPPPHHRLLARRESVALCRRRRGRSRSRSPVARRREPETVRTRVCIFVRHDSVGVEEVDPVLETVRVFRFENVECRALEDDVARFPSAVPLSLLFEVTGVIGRTDLFQGAAAVHRCCCATTTRRRGRARDALVLRAGRLHLMYFTAPKPKS